MSRYYGSVKGQAKTTAGRQGSKASGITGHIRGWDAGVKVVGQVEGGEDCFLIMATNGSNGEKGNRIERPIARITRKAGQNSIILLGVDGETRLGPEMPY